MGKPPPPGINLDNHGIIIGTEEEKGVPDLTVPGTRNGHHPSGYQPGQSLHASSGLKGGKGTRPEPSGYHKWAPKSLRVSTWPILIIKTHQISVFDIYIYNRPK